ncbi:FtsX-like permease family protein [Jannaschia sp. W003]|uniref:FtsX-like permease family protein n=1 Tax=Jannaschia sp. W003 TaxID=2867012 RepID=UPI0021A40CCD|nr:FtsX-like permease family protein [Jannaschia sp. W003]UWQ22992.1 FtsX-like permease family protein [Jannaschia sp. W003]
MAPALRALLGHWRRHPLQLATLVIGLALATGLWTGVQAINAQARSSYAEAADSLAGDTRPRLEGAMTLADFAAARRAGWLVTPVLEARLPGTRLRLLGVDPFTMPPDAAAEPLGDPSLLRDFLAGLVVLGAPDTVAGMEDPSLARAVPGMAPGLVVADIEAAQRFEGTDRVDALVVLPGNREGLPPLEELIPGTRLVRPEGNGGGEIARLTDSFHLNLTAFGLLSFAVGLFIVHAAIGLAFEQRRPLLRTLRAIGLSARSLTLALALELVALTLLGGGLGVVLGYLVAALLLPGVAATLSGLYGATVAGGLTLSPTWWLLGFAMAGAGLALAGGRSLWQLAHLPVLAPAMPRAWAQAKRRTLRWQMAGGLALLLLAALLAAFGTGLVAGFALLGALLLGAALLLPPILVAVLDLGARLARGPVAQWVWADARQQVPGLSLALMALLLALAANIGVGTMVGSFRATFTGWLDQRLAAELYLTAADAAEAQRMLQFLDGRVTALPIVSEEARVAGMPGEVFGIRDHATYRDHWPLLDAAPGAWDRLAAGEGAMVNEQVARREGLWTGDAIDLGRAGTWEIVGVYSDYGNPRGQAYLGASSFFEAFPDAVATRFALRVAPDEAPALADALAEAFALPPDRLVDQASVKRFSLEVFDSTFAVTAALNALTLGVAGFALWASLATLAGMRVPQVAPLWALGLTRRRIALLDVARAAALAALTAVLAIPVGIVLAWALLAVVNVLAFGWLLPLALFPLDWLRLAALALVAATLAAALPALRLWRMPPADLVKVFAHER